MQSDIKYQGIYRGIVVATNDPENLGRITVRVPQVFGTEVTNWAWPIRKNDTVVSENLCWIMFEGGDPDFPLWLGTF